MPGMLGPNPMNYGYGMLAPQQQPNTSQRLLQNPAFATGMSLLQGATPSRQPPNFASNLMQGLSISAGMKRQMEQDQRQREMDEYKKNLLTAQTASLMAPPERKIIKGADGFSYYADTGERVLPNDQMQQNPNKPFNPDGTPNLSYQEYQKDLKVAGKTDINIDTAGNSFDKEFGKQNAKNFFERRNAAADAVKSMDSINNARKLLDEGVRTGITANFRQGFGKLLQDAGIKYSDDLNANTDAFGAEAAKRVAQIIKAFGAGTGLSDADREYAEKAAAGKITMTDSAIRKLLDLNEMAARNIAGSFNKDAESIGTELSPFQLKIDIPESYVSPTQTQEVIDWSTP